MTWDIAVVADESVGVLVVHRANCPEAREAAKRGVPVATMLGCRSLPDRDSDSPWHECMDEIA